MRQHGWLVVVIVALIGCRSNDARESAPAAKATNPAPADNEPCAGTPRGDICSEELPVTRPLLLPEGGIRLVFEDDPTEADGGAHCRISDYTRTGVHTVTAACCERGHVVADALDEADQFHVLCEEGAEFGAKTVVARRMERDGTFRAASPVVDTGFPPSAENDFTIIGRHHLLIANHSMWVVYDVVEYGFKSADDASYLQRLTEGAKRLSLEGERFAAAYASKGALFVATTNHYGRLDVFYRVTEQELIKIDEPRGTADTRCGEAWHGTALDRTGALDLRFTQYLDPTESSTPVALQLPNARPLPSATSRGSPVALCNGLDDGFSYPLWLGDLDVADRAVSGSEALSCDAAGCIMIYVARHYVSDQWSSREIEAPRFWMRRFPLQGALAAP